MKYFLFILLFFIKSIICANEIRDTIKVVINLNSYNDKGLNVSVFPKNEFNGWKNYIFPFTVPGNYEFLDNQKSRNDFFLFYSNEKLCICEKEKNIYPTNWNSNAKYLNYNIKSTLNSNNGIFAIDSHFIKDSVYLLNWFNLLGFFEQELETPYKITIYKKPNLWGAGSLKKKILNDTTDIYFAINYKNLIANPVLYSIPDTTSFIIDETKFNISFAGEDTSLNSSEIKNLLLKPLTEVVKRSYYKHKQYTFIYYSENSEVDRYLTGLEHPNSTVLCYHSQLLDNNIVVSSSVHEYIHAIFAPLRIRSKIIDNYDFISTKSDEYLWFYEGVTEYLAARIMYLSGVFSREDFLNKLNESFVYQGNVNLQKTSMNIYRDYNDDLFENFYTKGSLLAFELDVEIMKLSGGKTCLFDIMRELQKKYTPEKPFNSKNFIKEFSKLSKVDIKPFIIEKTSTTKKVELDKIVKLIGYNRGEYVKRIKNNSYTITTWTENENSDSDIAKLFWNE